MGRPQPEDQQVEPPPLPLVTAARQYIDLIEDYDGDLDTFEARSDAAYDALKAAVESQELTPDAASRNPHNRRAE